uniref:hypothetical protein n=1 Tax=Salinibacter sp. TaxID=2065818 RepID=UPI0021E8A252
DEDRLAREFDPHDYESRDNIRLAIRGASQGGDLDAVKLGLMFAPPKALRKEFGSEEDLREGLNRAVWNSCEGMTPGEIERELQAAERAVDNTAAKLIDYVAGRIDGSPPVSILWSSANGPRLQASFLVERRTFSKVYSSGHTAALSICGRSTSKNSTGTPARRWREMGGARTTLSALKTPWKDTSGATPTTCRVMWRSW